MRQEQRGTSQPAGTQRQMGKHLSSDIPHVRPNLAALVDVVVVASGLCLYLVRTPPPPCISYALVQATVGVGTVIIVYLGVAYTRGGGYRYKQRQQILGEVGWISRLGNLASAFLARPRAWLNRGPKYAPKVPSAITTKREPQRPLPPLITIFYKCSTRSISRPFLCRWRVVEHGP